MLEAQVGVFLWLLLTLFFLNAGPIIKLHMQLTKQALSALSTPSKLLWSPEI